MDLTAVNLNITADDFDTVLVYDDQGQWTTPDPSARGFDGNDPAYLRGTYHLTEVVGAAVRLNFTGPAIYIYGHTGPRYGSFAVGLDSVTIERSAHATTESTRPTLLYSATNLTYAKHTLSLTNLGSKATGEGSAFLFDYLQWTIQGAPAGATIRNVTYEEDNAAFTYTGIWGNNTSPIFSGGGTTYTNADRATASLKFNGSAVYLLGDIKNDHRMYGVKLDDQPEAFFNGTSGCGGAFGLTCEQQVPILKFLGSNLDSSEHTLTVTNYAGVNRSFFDLDSVVVVVPSTYAPRTLVEASSPFVQPSSSPSASRTQTLPASSPSGASNSGGFSHMTFFDPVVLLLLLLAPLLRRKI